MTSTIALFSSRDELELLQRRLDFKELKLIAVTPEADFIAQEAQLKYSAIEDYYDAARLQQEGVDLHQTVADICDHLDSLFFSDKPTFSTHNFFYYLKIMYDQLLLNSHISRGLLELENPHKLLLSYLPLLEKDFLTADNKDMLFHVIFLFFKAANIKIEFYKKNCTEVNKSDLKQYLSGIKSYLSKRKHLLTCTFSNFSMKKATRVFIAQHWSYETCSQLNKFFKVYWLSDRKFKQNQKRKLNENFINNFDELIESIKQYYKFFDISLFEIIKSRLKFFIEVIAEKFASLVTAIHTFLKQKNINIFIAAQGQSLEILASTHAAKMLGLPIIWGQHGGLQGYAEFPINKYINRNYTHYLLYTKATARITSKRPYYVVSNAKLLKLYRASRYGF